jgi:hypothetical protein
MRITLLATVLALAACSSQRSPAKEPTSMTQTTGVAVESGPASPGDPSGLTPESGVKATSGSGASPMEGGCPRGEPSPTAQDHASCVKSCRGMDSTVPLGSRCLSEAASCISRCQKFTPP